MAVQVTVASPPTAPVGGDGDTRTTRLRTARPPYLVGILAFLVAAASLSPVGYLVLREGFSPSRVRRELDSPLTPELIRHTAILTGTVGLSTVVLGVGLAVLVVRTDLPLRPMWVVLFTMPLAVPGFVSSYTWVAASYRYFPTSTALYGLDGTTLVLALGLYPYVFLPTVAALYAVDASQEEAARALGRSRWNTFWTVTLPQLRPAIAAGSLIVMLHVLAEFGTPQLMHYDTITTGIMQRVKVFGDPEAARALSMVLVFGSVLLLVVERIIRGRLLPTRVGRGARRAPMTWHLGRAKPLWTLLATAVAVLSLGVPIYMSAVGLSDGFGSIDWSGLGDAAWQSTVLGIGAGLVATGVALPVSWLTARHPSRFASTAERAVWIAHSLPGVILALALVYIGIRWFHPLYQTSTMLVLAYVIMFLPLAVGAQHVGMHTADRHLDDASHALGCGRIQTMARVTLPVALPGIATGALFVLLEAEKELTTTLLLRPTGTDTLTTALWTTTNGEVLDYSAAAPYGVALVLVGAIPAYLLARRSLHTIRR